MAAKLFGEVIIGGGAVNNPPDYNWNNYDDYPDAISGRDYQRVNVIYLNQTLKVYLQVTGLAEIENGHARMGPTDSCLVPCPPEC